MQKMKAWICNAFHHINNIYRAVISLDQEQTKEITAEDGLIQKIVRKGRKTHTALAVHGFLTSLTNLPVFV